MEFARQGTSVLAALLVLGALLSGAVASIGAVPPISITDFWAGTAREPMGYHSAVLMKVWNTGKYALNANAVDISGSLKSEKVFYGKELAYDPFGKPVVGPNYCTRDSHSNYNCQVRINPGEYYYFLVFTPGTPQCGLSGQYGPDEESINSLEPQISAPLRIYYSSKSSSGVAGAQVMQQCEDYYRCRVDDDCLRYGPMWDCNAEHGNCWYAE